jgi:hypothetical protein
MSAMNSPFDLSWICKIWFKQVIAGLPKDTYLWTFPRQ